MRSPTIKTMFMALAITFPLFAYAIDIKVDRIPVNVAAGGSVNWTQVTFQMPFSNIPVVLVMPTNTNSEPATVRIRNITTTGFEVGLTEPPGENGQTAAMDIDYFAAEPGTYTFPGATRVIVDRFSTTRFQGRNVSGDSWETRSFSTSFGATPIVVTQVQSINSQPGIAAGDIANPFLEVAVRNVSTNSMEIALERAETSSGTLVAETIGYLAMESGDQVSIGGQTLRAQLTPTNIEGWDNGCFVNGYGTSYSGTPLVIASVNSRDGSDGGWVRRCSISASGVGLTIDEDRSADTDRSHTSEAGGILSISGAFRGSRNGRDMEAGSTSIASTLAPTTWTRVDFNNPFPSTPRIFALPTTRGSTPAALRVRNVSTSGFDIAAVQPTGGAGTHPEMDVDYVAIIEGEHRLPNGDVFEVGSIATSRYQAGLGGSTGTETVTFNVSRTTPPAVLTQIQTINNEAGLDPNTISSPWLVTAVTSIGNDQMSLALERTEALSGIVANSETIAYFAVTSGSNEQLRDNDDALIDYEMRLSASTIFGFDDGCYNVNFDESYTDPYALASQSSRAGNNGGWVRRCNLTGAQIGLTIDEDQANDSERTHTSERASVFVFSSAFEADFNRVDHYSINHAGAGVTCEASPITITAHDIVDTPIDASQRTILITATSSTPGWSASDVTWTLNGGTGVFSRPLTGVAQYEFGSSETTANLLLANTSEADIDIDIIDIEDNTLADVDGSVEDPLLRFAATGLRFYNDADNDGNADGTTSLPSPLTAGLVSGQLILRAVDTDAQTGACVGRAVGNRNVNMGYECVNPDTCIRNNDMQINGTAIADNNLSNVTDFAPVSLVFDAEGEAPFTLRYDDAGQIRLYASLDLPAAGGDPAISLTGASNDVVVQPANLAITAVNSAAGTANPGTTTSGSGFVISGSPFEVIVAAQNALGTSTPNFGNESLGENIRLNISSLVMPAGGVTPALAAATAFSAVGSNSGQFRNTSVSWQEAGTITVNASIADGDYLGSGDITGANSGNIGRFYPSHFSLLSGSVDAGCLAGNFSYMSDQAQSYLPMHTNYTIAAETAGNIPLQNYDAALGYPVESFAGSAENNNNGTNLGSRLQLPAATWVNGQMTVASVNNTGFRRTLNAGNEQPDGPFNSLQFSLQRTNASPDNTDFASLDSNANTTGDCTSDNSCSSIALGSGQTLRFGRATIDDAFGPESAPLKVPFFMEYWNGGQFIVNTDDSCTAVAVADIAFDGNDLSNSANLTVTVGAGSSTGSFDNFTALVAMQFIAGDGQLNFSAPGVGNTGEFDVDINLTNLPHLRFDWDNNGDSANDSALPTAQVRFGSYRGHDRVIFWRELFQ